MRYDQADAVMRSHKAQEQAGVLSSVTDIEEARRGLNSIVQRLRTLDPLEATTETKGKGRAASPGKGNASSAAALQQLRDSEDAVRTAQAEARQLRLELQAARGSERAAREETERIRQELSDELRRTRIRHDEELRAAREKLADGIKRDEVDALQAKIQEQ